MPTYEYECSKCKRVFEIRQRISEPALTSCDRCGGAVRRLLSPAPFILKGGGWYVTDYPSESRKQAIKSESSSASTGAQSSTGDGGASPSSGDSGGSSSNGAGSSDGAKAKPAAKSASKASKKGKD